MLEAIIFDMDGVLVETTSTNFESFNLVLKEYGVKIEKKGIKKYLGRSLKDQLIMWKKEYPQIPKELDAESFSKRAFDYQLDLLKSELEPNKAILNLIKFALSKNIKIAVATSSTKERAKTILKRIGVFHYLESFVTSEDITRHKPYPDVFLKAASDLNIVPENCVVIEDALSGIKAANSAGMKSVAKLTDYQGKDDFKGADYIFSDFEEIKLKDLQNLFNEK